MYNITAKDVQTLRAKTGVGIMECKKALGEANGNMDEAVKLLRERGLAVAAKKADRITAEGLIDILYDVNSGIAVMIEINSETDFVAKNVDFQNFTKGCLNTIIKNKPTDVEQLLSLKYDDTDSTVDVVLKEKILSIGENITIRRFIIVEGVLSTYIHGKGTIGVIVKFNAGNADVSSEQFKEFAKNIALQVSAMSPIYLSRDNIPADVLENEKEIIKKQIINDPANEKKPEAIIEKMTVGRLNKYFETSCLLDQGYVKEDSLSVSAYIDSVVKSLNNDVKIDSYYRFEKGEGLQKREENFADEIAKLTQG